jgi:hypothetical protein
MNIIEKAKYEMDRTNFDPAEQEVIVNIMELFFQTWDSEESVSAIMPILFRLMIGVPLFPLTGKEDEWVVHDYDAEFYAQNRRCGTVFRRRDGTSYALDRAGNHVNIQFPYFPPLELPK